MSLILGVLKGEKIYLNEVPMEVVSTSEDMRNIEISIEGNNYSLTDQRFIEVYPEVFAAVGKPRYETAETLTRIAFDAPRSIKILRENVKNSSRNTNTKYASNY